jgi:glycine/D-amino acid oxidase-like deaminating enzyme
MTHPHQNRTNPTGLWGQTATDSPATQSLTGDADYDVVVIGAGFTGLSAALHLAELGQTVAVLEANQLGHGGSGRNVGLVNAGMWMPYADIEQSMGMAAGSKLINTLERAPKTVFDLIKKHSIECEAIQHGTLNCAYSKKALSEITKRAEHRTKLGSSVEVLGALETANRTGTNLYAGALFDKDAGTIQPLSFVHGLARAAQSLGADIYTNSPARSITPDGDGWRVHSQSGSLRATKILIAVGAYGHQDKDTSAPVRGGAHTPLWFFQCATKPLNHSEGASILPGGEGVWDTDPVMKSFRRDQAGRLIVGSIGKLENLGNIHSFWAERLTRKLYPELKKRPSNNFWDSKWYGCIGMTHDHLPKAIQCAPGIVSLYGFNGRGIGPGVIFGSEIAEYFTSGDETVLSLPITQGHTELLPALRGLLIETSVRLYHTARIII